MVQHYFAEHPREQVLLCTEIMLDICAYVTGGRLTVECGFDAATAPPDSIARLMSCIEEALMLEIAMSLRVLCLG